MPSPPSSKAKPTAFNQPRGLAKPLCPPFMHWNKSGRAYLAYAGELASLADIDEPERSEALARASRRLVVLSQDSPGEDRGMLVAAGRLLTDLVRQQWRVRVEATGVVVEPPTAILDDPQAEKQRVRSQELVKRAEQLNQPAVREFIRSMETKRLHDGHFVSILSLLRDGRELADAIRAAIALPPEQMGPALDGLIDPYLQFVSDEGRCPWTGLKLTDIWRYFRHTWVNQYVSVPGRTMNFLVRDRAAPRHPIIGIGALSSPVVQIRERDEWVGWHPKVLIEQLETNGSDTDAHWLVRVVDTAIGEIYVQDFLEEELLTQGSLHRPTNELIAQLVEEGKEARKRHHRLVRPQEHKDRVVGEERTSEYWERRARTQLFRSKRAIALAELLFSRLVLRKHMGQQPSAKGLSHLIADPEGRRVVLRAARKAKADRVGILVADISVCGALAPYNALLGGKLVATLATSPEIVAAYGQRYGGAVSEIASGMAGRPISRPARLVLLTTTSLYGIGSSQYNRVSIPCDRLGGRPEDFIRYEELERPSQGYGTSQFSEASVDALVRLVRQSAGGQRVNSIFGEGVSPKLRKIREGLDVLGFPSDQLLRHGRHRIVYCVTLIENTREFLLGMAAQPQYRFSLEDPDQKSQAIVQWWRERWFRRRAQREEVLADVARHTLVYPIRHGARVFLPSEDQDQFGFSQSSGVVLRNP